MDTLSRLLDGRAELTPDMATRFEKAFDISAAPTMWAAYELAQIEGRSDASSIERVPKSRLGPMINRFAESQRRQ